MVEVTAQILQRAVYIPDEDIECEIVLTYHGQNKSNSGSLKLSIDEDQPLNENTTNYDVWNKTLKEKDKVDSDTISIAWASAQIYCQCDINERHLKIPQSLQYNKHNQIPTTCFSPVSGERGHCLFTTKAHIIFCDLKLRKGESKKYRYSEKIPSNIPPSYKGHNIKFSYKLCVGIGRIGHPLCMLRLPFRLFELKAILKRLRQRLALSENDQRNEAPTQTISSSVVQDSSVSSTSNPFIEDNLTNSFSTLDLAMDALTAFTVKRNLNTYNIQSANGAVGKFCLSKHYFRLGEEVLGTFDFSESVVKCIKYVVSLQVEETISTICFIQPAINNLLHYMTVSRYEECCYLTTKTNFLLPIPVTATPEFNHKMVSVKWRLHFEFTIEVSDVNVAESSNPLKDLSVPKHLKSEFMLWDLPVHVVATNPILASLMMQAESSESVILN